MGSCLFGGNLPTGITSFQQDGRYGSWRIPFTTFRRLQYRSHLDYDHRMSWIMMRTSSDTRAICIHGAAHARRAG
ncbi:hypothetical protein HMPREF9597_01509 [Cutibacterium acnes HL005PA4]|nr:hypothetical protein HMPREF9576_01624 [Cutibacterium acnes HL110PA2]EFS79355.1 hypothetical protein HMPREF9597_01509 [Cutibacterium acnes HL005PA4]EFT20058.1 hypothetical protein HMPREF9566_01984 [Cutibacterium acnes HL045PA1]EFT52696.1 hypothetical protein HMPREF9569_02008 [Cutibacterium acnes HL078PA1]EFT68176.1 hypothetical protein HMPREF9583_01788 [Cutibacterium acnes HL038PA1]EFT73157.1 hypothetical protein HMPREF9592_02331 [Cutibacterium acnes HL046PA1]EFT80379.1 hypothetical protein